MTPTNEANVHRLFVLMLLLKAANSLLEIVSGVLLLVLETDTILTIANRLTQDELLEDPHDVVANYILRSAQDLSLGAKTTAAFFLLSHGVIKLVLVLAVLAGFGWAYPAFIAALALLIAYQTYQLSHIFSLGLFALTVLDVVVLVLTVHEYRLRRTERLAT